VLISSHQCAFFALCFPFHFANISLDLFRTSVTFRVKWPLGEVLQDKSASGHPEIYETILSRGWTREKITRKCRLEDRVICGGSTNCTSTKSNSSTQLASGFSSCVPNWLQFSSFGFFWLFKSLKLRFSRQSYDPILLSKTFAELQKPSSFLPNWTQRINSLTSATFVQTECLPCPGEERFGCQKAWWCL